MKLNNLTKIVLGGTLLGTFSLTSCTKDDIEMPETGGGIETPTDTVAVENKINFTANVLSIQTRTSNSAPIADGRNVHVEAYSSNNWIQTKKYTSLGGNLNPLSNEGVMTVPTGKYEFYAVGANTTGADVPEFSGSTITSLQNGIDYIWAKTGEITPKADVTNTIGLDFGHSCARVMVRLTPDNGITFKNVTLELSTPNASSSQWNLKTGAITPATEFNSGLTVVTDVPRAEGDVFYHGQMVMLPMTKADGKIKASFTILMNDETTPRSYNLELPLKEGSLIAGNSYVYYTAIKNNNIEFTGVTVKEWNYIPVNDSDAPIIPDQN